VRFLLQICAIVREATDRMISLPRHHMAYNAMSLHRQVECHQHGYGTLYTCVYELQSAWREMCRPGQTLRFDGAAPTQRAHDIAYAAPLPLAVGQ